MVFYMNHLEAARHIALKLSQENEKLVILSGSAARGKENPSDLDISAVFSPENHVLNLNYRDSLVKSLSDETGHKLELLDFSLDEFFIAREYLVDVFTIFFFA